MVEGMEDKVLEMGGVDMQEDNDPGEMFDASSELGQIIDGLPEEGKALLSTFLTTEFTDLMGLLLGEPVKEYLSQYVDPNMVLVPMDRAEVDKQLASLQQPDTAQDAAPAVPAASPVSQPQQAQPTGATQPSGPTMGMLAG